MYLNKVQLIGNLTRDIELKALPQGTKVVSISLATNRVWKDSKDQKQESTEYHNILAFGKQAETLAQYAKKGTQLYVEGRLQTRSWDGEDGKKKYRTEIILESFQFGKKPETEKERVNNEASQKLFGKPLTEEEQINIDDIPF